MDRTDLETKLRRLSNLLRNVDGATTMTATYSDGTAYAISVYYAGGADAVYGDESNSIFARWVLNLQAPSPFWSSSSSTTLTVSQANIGRGLLPQLSRLKLTGTQAIGTITVNNTAGDVPSFPIWKLYGPLDNASIYTGTTGFVYNAAIAAGEVITIDTSKKTVVDASGTNKYANLSSAPKFFSLPPGTTSISVLGNGATSASKISLTYAPRREVIH
jgi:phage-related protein